MAKCITREARGTAKTTRTQSAVSLCCPFAETHPQLWPWELHLPRFPTQDPPTNSCRSQTSHSAPAALSWFGHYLGTGAVAGLASLKYNKWLLGLLKKLHKIIIFPTYKTIACICYCSRNVFSHDKLKRQEGKDFREKSSLVQDPLISEEGQRSFWALMLSLGLRWLKTAWFSYMQQNKG